MKRVLPVLLALCLFLSACGGNPGEATEPSTEPSTEPIQSTAEPVQTTAPTEPEETTEPTIAQIMVDQNPLTGEPSETLWTARPFAITLNNVNAALPHHGISQADIIYECLVEGGVTRCLAIFGDISEVEKYGSVRSARICFVDLVRAYDAIFAHAGSNSLAGDYINNIGWDHLDAITGPASAYFYRDSARLSSGYALEHTLFTSGANVIQFAKEKGFALNREEGIDYGLIFAEDGTPDGETANKVVFHFRNGGKTTTMTYNSETGLYEGYEYGKDIIDGNTDEIVGFKNVLGIFSETHSEGVLTMMKLTGSGEGYFACGGKIVPILWSREGDDDPFTYTLTDGTPLTLGIGTSYIAIIPTGSPIDYE